MHEAGDTVLQVLAHLTPELRRLFRSFGKENMVEQEEVWYPANSSGYPVH